MTAFVSDGATAGALTRAEQRLRRGLGWSLGVGLATLLALAIASFGLYTREQYYSRWVEHTYAAEARIASIGTLVEQLETARRGYLITPDPNYLVVYAAARNQLTPAVDDVSDFTADNPRQVVNIALLRALISLKTQQIDETLALAKAGGKEGAQSVFVRQNIQRLTKRLRDTLVLMTTEESRLLEARTAAQKQAAIALLFVTLGVVLVLAALAVGAVFLMRRFAEALQQSQGALRRMNEGLEVAVSDRTADLTRANDEIQRFAYIVSHDLRSPLVNVMGFTSELETALKPLQGLVAGVQAQAPDLLTKDARLAVEEDFPEAIGFIRSSTKKMDRLINAILRLSREGRRNLTSEPLAMDVLMGGIADSLRQLAEAKGAEIEVEPHMPELVSDRVAIEQVFSNLVENAVKYPQPGRPGRVVVRGRVSGGRLVYEVEDNGRGVAPQDHERIFELFRRSGAQDQPGEGIGLAHVRALVYRLGGVITCTSELGHGATFRVSLPLRIEHDQGLAA